jgi:hypothetical protein
MTQDICAVVIEAVDVSSQLQKTFHHFCIPGMGCQ